MLIKRKQDTEKCEELPWGSAALWKKTCLVFRSKVSGVWSFQSTRKCHTYRLGRVSPRPVETDGSMVSEPIMP